MEDKQKQTVFYFSIVFLLLLAGFIGVLVKIGITQTIEKDALLKIAARQRSVTSTLEPNRGNIYDCQGRLLAGSVPTYYIYMDTRVSALHNNNGKLFYQNIDSLSIALSEFFQDRTPQEYKQYITDGYNHRTGRLRLYPNRITHSQLKAVQKMPLFSMGRNKSGLIFESKYQRIKPFGSLASRSIGSILGDNGNGSSGLELYFNSTLHGQDGETATYTTDGFNITRLSQEPIDGSDVVTTIDATLQDIVETNLRNTLIDLDADWGCCILMETHTGEIKAISNLGKSGDDYIESHNYAVTRMEPGSTFKTISLMAALDDGKIKITDTISPEHGSWIYTDSKNPIKDSHSIDHNITIKQAFAASSNIALAKIVTHSYDKKASKFVDKLEKMRVSDSIPFQIPGTNKPRIIVPKDGETLARMAFGYYVELSPLSTLTFYNAIANNGKMVRPYLVKEIRHNDEIVEKYHTTVISSSICKSSTIKDIRECLEAVVWNNEYGTASVNPWGRRKAQSDIVHIAGKTGTVQILDNGRYSHHNHRISFCGYFPMENPQYTCICVVHNPQRPNDSGMHCGGTVRRIAEKTMAYSGSKDVTEFIVPSESVSKPYFKKGMQKDLLKVAKGINIYVKKTDSQWVKVNKDYQAEPINVSTDIVPNVLGMGAKDAVYAIEQIGMLVHIKGKGAVVEQSIAPGSKITKGGIVYLTLR